MAVEERLLLVYKLMEMPEGDVAKDEVMQEFSDKNQTDLYQLMAYCLSVHDTTA